MERLAPKGSNQVGLTPSPIVFNLLPPLKFIFPIDILIYTNLLTVCSLLYNCRYYLNNLKLTVHHKSTVYSIVVICNYKIL